MSYLLGRAIKILNSGTFHPRVSANSQNTTRSLSFETALERAERLCSNAAKEKATATGKRRSRRRRRLSRILRPNASPRGVLKGSYELQECLGSGLTGTVYFCRNFDLFGHPAAVKILSPEAANDSLLVARFQKEMLISHRVTHSNILRIYEKIQIDELPAFIMEYADGGKLADLLLSKEGLSLGNALDIFLQLSAGIRALHRAGVVHGSLGLNNILLNKNGCVKITNFGDSHIDETSNEHIRQFNTDDRSDPHTDIVALGSLMYEILSGERPFCDQDMLWAFTTRRNSEKPHLLNPLCPEALSDITMKALWSQTAMGYHDIEELQEDLNTIKQSLISGRPMKRTNNTAALPPTPRPNKDSFGESETKTIEAGKEEETEKLNPEFKSQLTSSGTRRSIRRTFITLPGKKNLKNKILKSEALGKSPKELLPIILVTSLIALVTFLRLYTL